MSVLENMIPFAVGLKTKKTGSPNNVKKGWRKINLLFVLPNEMEGFCEIVRDREKNLNK